MRHRSTRIVGALVVGVLAAAALTSCTASSSGDNGAGGVVTIGTGGVFTTNNNPFAPTSSATSNGWAWLIYEPLVQSNGAVPTAAPKPWLASAFKWTSDYKSVAFTARKGVKWSDGKAFTAADVAFTFNLIKGNKALNTSNLPISSVETAGDTVTVAFSQSQFVNQSKVTGQFIVPQHVWSKVSNPSTYADTKPIGTGPFLFTSSTSSVAKLAKNPSYWQAGKVKAGTVIYQALQGNDPILNALAGHKLDWASSFALNQKTGFTDKDPKQNLAWNVSKLGMDAFIVNIAKAPFNDVALRRAMSMVIDSSKASQLATGGLLSPVKSVTGLPQPVGDTFIADTYKDKDVSVDIAGAKSVLTDAGYTFKGSTLTAPNGKAVTITLTDPAGYTDYLTELQVIKQDLSQIGITSTIETPSADAWGAALATGDYDAAMRYSNSGATPYDLYATYMDGAQYQPIGTTANGNLNRFKDTAATEALNAYATAANDADRAAALAAVQKAWVEKVPAIAMISKADTGMFTTTNWTGWPSADNPYADPSILNENISQVLTTIQPAK